MWLLNTKWQDKDYLFAINGQTGKTVGDLPVDKGKYWGMFAGLSVGLTIISALLINLFA